MTIAVALIHNGETWLGSDRQSTYGDRERAFIAPKWVIASDRSAALACSGQGLAGNLLRENADSIFKGAGSGGARGAWRSVTAVFRDHGWHSHVEGNNPPCWDVDLLFVVPGFIFHISRTGSTRMVTDAPYYVTGSGDAYALGALHALQPTDADGRTRVLAAVTAATRYDIRCGGEPWVEQL